MSLVRPAPRTCFAAPGRAVLPERVRGCADAVLSIDGFLAAAFPSGPFGPCKQGSQRQSYCARAVPAEYETHPILSKEGVNEFALGLIKVSKSPASE